jgi:hypothetical protein
MTIARKLLGDIQMAEESHLSCRFGGAIFSNARSNASPLSSTPSFRAVSLNRSDCSAFVIFLVGFGVGFRFSAIPVWSFNQSFDR